MRIAVFSAFPQELKYIRKNSVPLKSGGAFRIFVNKRPACDLIAIETGMGNMNLESSFNHIVKVYRPDIILSIGFGGALYYRADIGELVFGSRYFILTREGAVEFPQLSTGNAKVKRSLTNAVVLTGLRQKISVKEGSFVTLSEWMAKSKLKAFMPENAAFPVCDRETIHLAKISYRNNLPFFAIRSITDRLDRDIPEELFNVTDENGNYRLSRALALLLSRPSLIIDAVKLGRNAALASKNLWEAVKALTEVLAETCRCAVPDKIAPRQRLLRANSITKTDFG